MQVLVPYDVQEPKTRLSAVFDANQRQAFSRVMLDDVLRSLHKAGHDPIVLATAAIDCESSVIIDERPLTVAVNGEIDARDPPTGVVMADLGLVTAGALNRLFETPGDVVIAPGVGGGTNALVVRESAFQVDYHGLSFRDHCAAARQKGYEVSVVDSFRLAMDVDEPDNILEVLLHGEGCAREWLTNSGASVDQTGDEPTLSFSEELE
ncbi:2-phospho-L-lactate guanylyltransferase [Halovenus rubra]|uniref:2-phospho-L-lactate guanylyltransferase n=2 Tax=Halovenus rubra TaxID=869890 RepID=A0ACC7E3P8_9EURY|nr:2-phospho-L-lactate guanylyltransferase [Halovenus rubra]